ncbi:MAG TPA: AsmA-like C-terminal region-containing protein, partial [Longimicrobiales bacterium]
MSLRRKVALSIAGVLALLIILLALTPLLFRDRIEARVKSSIAQGIDARVDWRSLRLGLVRTFPNLSLQLRDLTVTGVGAFQRDTLVSMPQFQLVIDLGSALRSLRGQGPLVVRSVELRRPAAHLLVLENGAANWNIVHKGERTAPARGFDLSLRHLDIKDGHVAFENRQTGLVSSISGLQHSLSGDFRKQRFTLQTHTSADTTSLRFAGVPYLAGAHVDIDAQIAADMAARSFTLRDNRIRLNDLLLSAAGTVGAIDKDVAINLAFKAPRTDFREILSLLPVIAHNYSNLKTSGTMSVQGVVRGRWGKQAFPSFALRANVENGTFRYPDLPLPARDIQLRLALTNPGGNADRTVLNINRFHVVLGNDPIDGSLIMRTPISDPDVGVRVTGKLDLANVPRTVKLKNVKELSGIVIANAAMRARMSDIDQKRYDRVSADGGVEIRQLALSAADLRQPLKIDQAVLELTPRQAELTSFRGRAGASDITLTGSLENLLGFALHQEDLRGNATVASRHFDLNEWRSDDELKAIAVPGNIDFALRATAETVQYGNLTLKNARGALRIKDRRVTLEDFRMDMLGGGVTVAGFYETLDPNKPKFDLAVDLDQVDVPAAFAGIRTIQAFAPVARYAEGRASAKMKLNGALGPNMMPVFQNLSGLGSLLTSGLVLRNFPALNKLADALKVDQLRNPGFVDLKSSFAIENGRLSVRPFDVRSGPLTMTVAGSNGIDQSLDYTLALRLPRAILGSEANQAVTSIVNRTARAGINLQAADSITLGVRIGGKVTNPTVSTSFREATGNAAQQVATSLRQEAQRQQQLAAERVDSAAELAKRRLLEEAETRAAAIRSEAASVADKLRREGHERADSLEAHASGLGKIAARAAAARLRKETDAKADAIIREADTRAAALVTEARQRADT